MEAIDRALDRHERVTDAMIERLNDLGERLHDLGGEVRAQTRAIFKLIDRLEGGASAA